MHIWGNHHASGSSVFAVSAFSHRPGTLAHTEFLNLATCSRMCILAFYQMQFLIISEGKIVVYNFARHSGSTYRETCDATV